MERFWQVDPGTVAAVVPPVRAAPPVKCHCQLLYLGFRGSYETHFLCLNTFCQGRKGPIWNLLCPALDREHLTANGSVAPSQMRYPSVPALPSVVTQWLHFLYTGLQFLQSFCLYLPGWTGYCCCMISGTCWLHDLCFHITHAAVLNGKWLHKQIGCLKNLCPNDL